MTIVDLIDSEYFAYFCTFLMVFLVGGIVSASEQNMVSKDYPATLHDLFYVLVIAWIKPILVVVVLLIAVYILYRISQIKIAKCELKNKEE